MNNKQKLELTWVGKENRSKLEPRILREDPQYSHHAAYRVTRNDTFDNILIQGDNLLEPKRRADMETPEVVAKRDAGVLWCQRASEHSASHGGKPWKYVLIPHDVIAENMTLEGLAGSYTQQ